MEILNNIFNKLKKKPKPIVIKITSITTKSCKNCDHLMKRGDVSLVCGIHPNAELTDVINKLCKVDERPHWTPKRYGLFRRLMRFLF